MTQAGKNEGLIPYGGGNVGMPLELTDGLLVPLPVFFTRSNGPVPEIDPATWRLTVDGMVNQPLSLSLADLKAMGETTITAFLECAGNGRTRFEPLPEGTPWVNDAAGNATWTGIPLATVLARAGVKPGAVDIVAQGADFADMKRGLPLANALDPATMLVWAMNGEPLTVPHGAPVRLFVSRWAGISSTKWLTSLTVTDKPFIGFYNANNYVMISPDGEHLTPVREMPVKSLIQHPLDGATLAPGSQRITGYAWSGFGGIARVDISTDGGESWREAKIVASAGPLSWVQWAIDWQATPGEARIRARATDERTMVQPAEAMWNKKGYLMNGIQEIAVTVRER